VLERTALFSSGRTRAVTMRSYAPLVLHYFFTAFACAAAGTKMFDGEYHKIWHDENIFHPEKSMTFQLVRLPRRSPCTDPSPLGP
jgi:alpha-beta hydrolase superfamily lysophospholipase